MQPENWRVTLTTPNLSLNAEYWQGDTEAHIEQKEANAWATLANFHKGSGMSNAWYYLPTRWRAVYWCWQLPAHCCEPLTWAD